MLCEKVYDVENWIPEPGQGFHYENRYYVCVSIKSSLLKEANAPSPFYALDIMSGYVLNFNGVCKYNPCRLKITTDK